MKFNVLLIGLNIELTSQLVFAQYSPTRQLSSVRPQPGSVPVVDNVVEYTVYRERRHHRARIEISSPYRVRLGRHHNMTDFTSLGP